MSKERRYITKLFCIFAALIVLTGCSDGRPKRVAVSGKVTIDGKPLTTGAIRFYPKTVKGRPASSKISSDGSFTLSTFDANDGCPIGTFDVMVIAAESISETQTKWHAPKKYSDPETAGITKMINDRVSDLAIELTWKGSGHNAPFIVTE